jgi:hypothetical protein
MCPVLAKTHTHIHTYTHTHTHTHTHCTHTHTTHTHTLGSRRSPQRPTAEICLHASKASRCALQKLSRAHQTLSSPLPHTANRPLPRLPQRAPEFHLLHLRGACSLSCSRPYHTRAFQSMQYTRRESAIRAISLSNDRQVRKSRRPAGQASQREPSKGAEPSEAATATEPKPATQRHSALPSAACELGAHATQANATPLEYVSATQFKHRVEPLASAYWPARQG